MLVTSVGRWLAWLGLCISGAGCRQQPAWAGAEWRPTQAPQRIVAASLLATEVLLAIAPRERLAGVHELAVDAKFSLVVDAARGLPLVGADAEQLLAVRPDLVICDAYTRPETLAVLSAAAIPVVRTANPTDFDDIAGNVRRIGRLCHLDTEADLLVAAMQTRVQALASGAPAVAAWRVINLDGGLHTYGRDSLFAAVVTAAGAVPLAAGSGVGPFRKVDVEVLLSWQPDALVIGASPDLPGEGVPPWIEQHPGLQLLRCVQSGRVVRVPAPLLNTTSHRLVEVAELLQRELNRLGKP